MNAWKRLREVAEIHRHDEYVPVDYADLTRVLDALADYENSISWNTNCLGCADMLDKSYSEYVRAEQAEERVKHLENELAERGWDQ